MDNHQLGQAAKDTELVTFATEFKLRCERRLGELLGQMKDSGSLQKKGGDRKTHQSHVAPTLKEVGISRDLSSRAQRIAAVPEAQWESIPLFYSPRRHTATSVDFTGGVDTPPVESTQEQEAAMANLKGCNGNP